MKKIDIQNYKNLLFVDTETIGTLNVKESVFPFEIGIKVVDIRGDNLLKEKSYLVRKFINNKYVMLSSFSANKYPNYLDKLQNDKRFMIASVNEIMKDITKLIKKYDIKIMVAHNGGFDKQAINKLCEEFAVNNPFNNLDLLDTMELSKVITYSKDYTNYCIENIDIKNSINESAFITNSGRVRTTAQAIYSFLVNNPNFQESHTALEDIDIELTIFYESLQRLGNTLVPLNTTPTWRDFSVVWEKEEEE